MLWVVGSLLIAFGIFGIWFVFHIRSRYGNEGANKDIFLLFLFPIIIIIGTGVRLTFNYSPTWLNDAIYFVTPLAWVLAYIVYLILYVKNKNSQKDKGR